MFDNFRCVTAYVPAGRDHYVAEVGGIEVAIDAADGDDPMVVAQAAAARWDDGRLTTVTVQVGPSAIRALVADCQWGDVLVAWAGGEVVYPDVPVAA